MPIKNSRKVLTVSPTVDTSIYASGDAISTIQTLSAAFLSSDQSGILKQLIIADGDDQKSVLDIMFFESTVTGAVDNAAYAPSFADLKKSVGLIKVAAADYVTIGTEALATINLTLNMQLEQNTSLFFQIISRGTPTYTAATNLQLKFVIEQD